jgi:hypothetical protein
MDIVAGKFTGGDIDDVVMIWEGPNRSIIMAVPGIDAGTMTWSDENVFMLKPEGTLADVVHSRRQMRIVKGSSPRTNGKNYCSPGGMPTAP